MLARDIYDFTRQEETGFNTPVEIEDGWSWNFPDHVRLSVLYKNSQFELKNDNRDKRPFKNVIRPILNLQYRTEGFDVKDIELYVNSSEDYYKSFLVKKFHEKWALENELDTFIDEVVESYVDFGGVLVKNIKGVRPEVVALQSLAFCDQTDLLNGPFAIKHYLSPHQVLEMYKSGWGEESNGATIDLKTLVTLSDYQKRQHKEKTNQTPGRYIEVYEIHGQFPGSWLKGESDDYIPQVHVVSFYKDQNNLDQGVTLFKSKEPKENFKFLKRDPVYGRALGFGGIEELFESQVWTNFSEIQMTEMLELAGKVLFKTTDPTFKNRNKITNLKTGTILDLQEGRDIEQLDTQPRNLVMFQNAVLRWEEHAKQMGAASEAILGESPSAGTPFKLQELIVNQAEGVHEYRKGKLAVFMDEIYRDWILPYIEREIKSDQKFLATLDLEEMQYVVDSVMKKEANDFIKEKILNGELVDMEEVELVKQTARENFMKDNRKFTEIFKKDFKDVPLDVKTNIAGKQKNLSKLTDKVVNVFRQLIAAPQILDDPRMAKIFNSILESSGLSPVDFGAIGPRVPTEPAGTTEPLKQLLPA